MLRDDSGMEKRIKNKKCHRVVLYPKDIQLLMGKSYRYALYLNKEIRAHYQKKKHQFLTVNEFAEYTGIGVETIYRVLK